MVLDCDNQEVGRYYRNLYSIGHNHGKKLVKPFWDLHVAIVRNEEPADKALWWQYAGEEIEFNYYPGLGKNFAPDRFKSFFWVNATSPRFTEIRAELGLPKKVREVYHMTIGVVEDWSNRY